MRAGSGYWKEAGTAVGFPKWELLATGLLGVLEWAWGGLLMTPGGEALLVAAIAFLVYFGRVVHAAWILPEQRAAAKEANANKWVTKANSERRRAEKKLAEVLEGLPNVVPNGEEAFHVERVFFGFPADVLCLRLINLPVGTAATAVAEDVRAHFRCEGEGADGLPSLDARWSDTPEPTTLPAGQVPPLGARFGLGEQHQLNFILKEPSRNHCFLFSNHSYSFDRVQNPDWAIPPGKYTVVAKISGIGVGAEPLRCSFINPGIGRVLRVAGTVASEQKARQEIREDLSDAAIVLVQIMEGWPGGRSFLELYELWRRVTQEIVNRAFPSETDCARFGRSWRDDPLGPSEAGEIVDGGPPIRETARRRIQAARDLGEEAYAESIPINVDYVRPEQPTGDVLNKLGDFCARGGQVASTLDPSNPSGQLIPCEDARDWARTVSWTLRMFVSPAAASRFGEVSGDYTLPIVPGMDEEFIDKAVAKIGRIRELTESRVATLKQIHLELLPTP